MTLQDALSTIEQQRSWPVPGQPCAGIYLRISDDPGNDERGVTRQLKRGAAWAAQYGWHPVIYVDNDISATNGSIRPDYLRLSDDVENGRLKAAWSWGHDRIFRDNAEFEPYMAISKRTGTLFADRNGVKDLSKAGDRFNARNAVTAAAFEVENMKERQQEAFDQMVDDGLAFWSHRPFGYTMPKTESFVRTPPQIIPDEAAVIKAAYYDILNGRSMRSIAKEWNDKGFRTPARALSEKARAKYPGAAGGNLWTANNLRQLLLSPRNAGVRERARTETVNGKTRVVSREIMWDGKCEWEGIVPRSIYKGVVAQIRSRKRTANAFTGKYLLSGLAICGGDSNGDCNTPLRVSTRRTGERAYICPTCFKVRRKVERLDEFVTGWLFNELHDAKAIERRMQSAAEEIAELKAEEFRLDGIRQELIAMVRGGLATTEEIRADLKSATDDRDAAKSEREALEARGLDLPEVLRRLLEADDIAAEFHDNLTLEEQRTAVSALCTVKVKPGQPGGNAKFDPRYVDLIPTDVLRS
jgi:DNA invertase Pin-like site-specific DNA recombinase